jgi:hypothetical protein
MPTIRHETARSKRKKNKCRKKRFGSFTNQLHHQTVSDPFRKCTVGSLTRQLVLPLLRLLLRWLWLLRRQWLPFAVEESPGAEVQPCSFSVQEMQPACVHKTGVSMGGCSVRRECNHAVNSPKVGMDREWERTERVSAPALALSPHTHQCAHPAAGAVLNKAKATPTPYKLSSLSTSFPHSALFSSLGADMCGRPLTFLGDAAACLVGVGCFTACVPSER